MKGTCALKDAVYLVYAKAKFGQALSGHYFARRRYF